MPTRWSWNINGLAVPNWNQLVAWARQAKPTYTLVMDDKPKAMQWLAAVGGEMIYRTYDQRDNYYHHHVTGKQAAIDLERDHADFRQAWHYYRGNEMGGEWNRLQDWLLEFATEAKARGFKVTTLGLAIAKNWLSPEWVQAGNVDALIQYANANRDTFLIDTHEYTCGTTWSGHTPNYPANLFDRSTLLEWGDKARIEWDTYAPNWHLGRTGWVTNVRAKELGLQPLPFVMTEAIFDFMDDIFTGVHLFTVLPDGKRVHTETELRTRYGDVQYNRDIRGVMGQRKFFEWLITGQLNTPVTDDTLCNMIIRNFRFAEANYPVNCKGIMLFTMNENWRFPEGHDYIPIANALLPKMHVLALSDTPTQPPVEPPQERDMQPITVTGYRESTQTANKVNIRATPSTSAAIVGTLPAYPTVTTGYVADSEPVFSNGFSWQFYELSIADKTVSGYMATEFVKEVEDVEQYYDFHLGALTFRWTLQERDDIVNVFNITAAILDNAEPRYAAYADDIRTFASAIGGIEGRP